MRKIICLMNINTKAKAKNYFQGINFTLISVSTVLSAKGQTFFTKELLQGGQGQHDLCRHSVFSIGPLVRWPQSTNSRIV